MEIAQSCATLELASKREIRSLTESLSVLVGASLVASTTIMCDTYSMPLGST
jgi:hypothetical protein